MSSFAASTNTEWTFDQQVTGIINPALPGRESMISYALGFPHLTLDAPVTTGFTVKGYENAPGVGTGFAAVVANRTLFLGTPYGGGGMLRDLAWLGQAKNQSQQLRALYAYYGYSGDPGLNDYDTNVATDIAAIQAQINAYTAKPATAVTVPTYVAVGKGLPVLSYTEPTNATWGGNGGTLWDFMPVGDALRGRVKVASVQLAGGDLLDSITINYTGLRTSWSERHGGGGGDLRDVLYVDNGAYISGVGGQSGGSVDQLAVTLSNGRHTAAGGWGGNAFSWTAATNEAMIGFRGRSGDLVDQIQVVSAKLNAAAFV
jgi:hypothetical protein